MVRMWQMRLSTFLLLATAVPSPAPAKPAFTTKKDQYGTVYHVDFEQVRSPGDLTAIPGHGAVVVGETWNFQAWFRDNNPGQTSNSTDGYSILFQ